MTSSTGSERSSTSSMLLSNTEEVTKIFHRFDTNNDGKISAQELTSLLSALGTKTSPGEVERMMEEMDTDKDGVVTLAEFTEFCGKEVQSASGELRDAFDMYDQDSNGLISASELHLVLTRLGQSCSVQDCAKMIQNVDTDGDGHVNFDEFRKMMSHSV